jgi:hypothetical protein
MPLLTKRGCLALTFPYFQPDPVPKLCYLVGGRSLFILQLAGFDGRIGKELHKLICGDCFIDGFEDDKGLEIARSLGLVGEELYIV